MDETDRCAAAILACGHAREMHFDPEVATDGPFTILLTLYHGRADCDGLSMEAVISAVDNRMSTALYALERLVAWGYVDGIGNVEKRRFRLSVSAERMVERYLTECLTLPPVAQMRLASSI